MRSIKNKIVFLNSSGYKIDASKLRKLLKKSLRKAGIEDFIFHDFRHTFEEWRKEYNTVRPHSSLGYKSPAPESVEPLPLFYATH